MMAYLVLFYIWDPLLSAHLTDCGWSICVSFLGGFAAFASIVIHFYFHDKSVQTMNKHMPSLNVIVSTREGLETFLKFLVSELSVENLGIFWFIYIVTNSAHIQNNLTVNSMYKKKEFFTLSMRWRHRLVLLYRRREKKKLERQKSAARLIKQGTLETLLYTASMRNGSDISDNSKGNKNEKDILKSIGLVKFGKDDFNANNNNNNKNRKSEIELMKRISTKSSKSFSINSTFWYIYI